MKIEKGIPIPERRDAKSRGFWQSIISQMEIGDSVVVTSNNERRCLMQALYKKGLRATNQILPDGSYRVWRIE